MKSLDQDTAVNVRDKTEDFPWEAGAGVRTEHED